MSVSSNQTDFNFSDGMWIIPLLPERLPGRVERRSPTLIRSLIRCLPLSDGTTVESFFSTNQEVNRDDYVTFQWENPGERGFDNKKQTAGDPRAIDIKKVSLEEAQELTQKIRDKLAIQLRDRVKYKKDELDRLRRDIKNEIQEGVDAKVKEQKAKLDRLMQNLENKIQERVDLGVKEEKVKIEQKRSELDRQKKEFTKKSKDREFSLDSKTKDLNDKEYFLEQTKQELKSSIRELQELEKVIQPYRIAIPHINNYKHSNEPNSPFPEKLAKTWQKLLAESQVFVPENIAISYLLSLLSACYSGSLVLLNGPVGVGKTSIVSKSAEILGGISKIVPVRPAWLDPSDLLGFFDPLSETFRPSPFLTALKDVKARSHRLGLVCLDELNLARIENYGADILASLEYSHSYRAELISTTSIEKRGLLLYSPSIQTQWWQEVKFLSERSKPTNEETQRLEAIKQILKDYPSTFELSDNLILLGTLNSDETTYDLSPKVIDRSYVITYPPADLSKISFNVDRSLDLSTKAIVGISSLQKAIKESISSLNRDLKEWNLLVKWNQDYLSQLGIPLGYRTGNEYRVFHAVTTFLGLSSKDSLGHFLFTKILPRIIFFKNEQKNKLFKRWLNEIKQRYEQYDPSNILKQFEQQVQDTRRANVRYWTKV